MAGNKSNLPPMNGIDFGMSEIDKISNQAYDTPLTEERMRAEARRRGIAIDAVSQLPESMINKSKLYTRIQNEYPKQLDLYQQRIRTSVEGRLNRATNRIGGIIESEFSERSINSLSNSMQQDQNVIGRSVGMVGMSYSDLMASRQASMNNIGALGQQGMALSGEMLTKRGVRGDIQQQLSNISQQASGHIANIASMDIALKQQRTLGLDPASQMANIFGSKRSAENLLQSESIRQEMNDTGGVSIMKGGKSTQVGQADFGREILSASKSLTDAFNEMTAAAKMGETDLTEFTNKIKESSESVEKLTQASAAGGGGWRGNGAQIASAIGGGFMAAGNTIQQIGVSQRLGQAANISGFAGIENQKYDMYKSARSGDVMSQLLLSQYGQAEGFGRELKTSTNAAQTAYMAGGAAQVAAGGLQVASTINPAENALSTSQAMSNRIAGASNIAQGASTAAIAASDIARNVSGGAAQIAGTQAQMDARRALLQVSATQLQGFRDYAVGAGVVAQQMGRGGATFLNTTMNDQSNFLGKIGDARMSPEQFNQAALMGTQTMGGQFDVNQVFAARGLERSGMGTMQENMQRQSMLAQAGSNNPQAGLESVIAAGMTKGLDNSKQIQLLTENTAAMVAGSVGAAMGINTTGAAAAMGAAGVDSNMANKEFAIQLAGKSADIANRVETNTSVSFAGMLNTARISETTSIAGKDAAYAQKIDAATLKSIQAMSPGAAVSALQNLGVGVNEKNVTADVNQLLSLKETSLYEGAGAGLVHGLDVEAIKRKQKQGIPLNANEEISISQTAIDIGMAGGRQLKLQGDALNSKIDPGMLKAAQVGTAGEGGDATLKTLDNLRTSGFKQLSEAASQAATSVGGAATALKTLVDILAPLEKAGATGKEGEMSTAASKSAATFGAATTTFDTAVNKFNTKIDALMGAAFGNNTAGIPTGQSGMSTTHTRGAQEH